MAISKWHHNHDMTWKYPAIWDDDGITMEWYGMILDGRQWMKCLGLRLGSCLGWFLRLEFSIPWWFSLQSLGNQLGYGPPKKEMVAIRRFPIQGFFPQIKSPTMRSLKSAYVYNWGSPWLKKSRVVVQGQLGLGFQPRPGRRRRWSPCRSAGKTHGFFPGDRTMFGSCENHSDCPKSTGYG